MPLCSVKKGQGQLHFYFTYLMENVHQGMELNIGQQQISKAKSLLLQKIPSSLEPHQTVKRII